MSPPARSALRRRERIAILAALGALTLLMWLWLFAMASGMDGMASPDGEAGMSQATGIHPWGALDFALMLLMWIVMMVGMMVPSAVPMTLVYAQVARKARREGDAIAPTGAFVAGYLLVWAGFSVAATGLQWALERAALLSPTLVTTSPELGAALLVAAGVYQLTPLKQACLRHCRSPAGFFARHWRPGASGALRMGIVHGGFCLGCCAVLMLLLFVGGVMNLLWIAAIALFVLLEKAVPYGEVGGRVAGTAMVVFGLALLAGLGSGLLAA